MTDISQHYLQALLEISQQINSIRQPEELQENILDIAIQQLSAERGFILLKTSPGSDNYQPMAVRNFSGSDISQVRDISHSTVDAVLANGEPLLSFDALSDERFDAARSVVLHQIQSIAVVPLMLRDEIQGVIYIDSRGQKARFTRESLDFLQAFANQAAIALENARLWERTQRENVRLKKELQQLFSFEEIVGDSPAMQKVFQMMGKVLNNNATVLLTGETGTGKEVVARAIHYNGARKEHGFVPVNCGAIPENLIESELFGHKKGAFTGAIHDKQGLIDAADGGTLFLDEVGELPPNVQIKLLRFLQERTYTPVGEVKPRKADVRVVAATNRDLQSAIAEGNFREDLYYRLNVIQISLPALRERRTDILLLARHFLLKYSSRLGKSVKDISPAALEMLQNYSWPGNVRELENTIERAVVLDGDLEIGEDDLLLPGKSKAGDGIEAGMTLEQISKILLKKSLAAAGGNRTRAAEMMGVSLRWVQYKMKEWLDGEQ